MNLTRTVLKDAFEATCRKRGTKNLKAESVEIIVAIEKDAQLCKLWKSYQTMYQYAADISYEDIMESMKRLLQKI